MDRNIPFGMNHQFFLENSLHAPHNIIKQPINDCEYYHYTSVANCINMLKGDGCGNHEFYASHLLYLNDKQEFENGYKLLKEKLEKIEEGKSKNDLKYLIKDFLSEESTYEYDYYVGDLYSRDLFIICFCRDGDLLSQWKYYGKQSGVAIEYNLGSVKYSGMTNAEDEVIKLPSYNVIYDEEEKNKITDKIIKAIVDYSAKDCKDKSRDVKRQLCRLFMLPPLFKSEGFSEEKETRLIFRPLYFKNISEMREKVEYRERNGVIIPYLKIRFIGSNTKVIKSITVGPGQNQDLVFGGLKHLISCRLKPFIGNEDDCSEIDDDSENVNGVLIRKSKIPFRG